MNSKALPVLTGLMLLTLAYAQPEFGQQSGHKEVLKDIAVNRQRNVVQQHSPQEAEIARPVKQATVPAEAREIMLLIDGSPFLGDKNAKLTLIEFSDYQ